jgi:hypothetical protein
MKYTVIDTRVFKDTASCLPFSESPDLIVIKVNDPKVSQVYSVEHITPTRLSVAAVTANTVAKEKTILYFRKLHQNRYPMGSLTVYVFLLLINPLWFLYNLIRLIQYQLELKTIQEKSDAPTLARHRKKILIAFLISAAILGFSIFVFVRIASIQA